eukprot:174931_1
MMTLLVSLIVLLHFTNGLLKCEDGSGRVTDWWFAIRNEGSRTFEYFDSILEANLYAQDREEEEEDEDEDVDVLPDLPDLQFNHFDFNTHDNPIERLLKHVREEANNRYSRSLEISRTPPIPPPTTGYIAYSDQSSKVSKTEAHAKGFIAWELGVGANQWKGYWLIHSQPYWPYFESLESEYCDDDTYPTYRSCSLYNRQSFFCISLKTEDYLKQAIKQTERMGVFVYDKRGARPDTTAVVAENGASFGGSLQHFFNSREIKNEDGVVVAPHQLAVPAIKERYGGTVKYWFWAGLNEPRGNTREHSKIGISREANVILGPYTGRDGSHRKRTRIESIYNHVVCVGDLNPNHYRQPTTGGGFMCLRARKLHQLIKNYYVAKGVYIISRSRAHAHATDNMLEYEDNTYVEYEYQNDKKWLFEYIYSYLSLLSIVGMIFFMVGLIASAFCGNAIQWILDSKMFT